MLAGAAGLATCSARAGEGAEEDDEDVRLVDAAQGDGAVAFRRQSAALTDISLIMVMLKSHNSQVLPYVT